MWMTAGVLAYALSGMGDRLTIGDEAPPIDVFHWLKGEALTDFEPGRVYVLEFWATWCGPCVANMEHLSQIQERYADRGVVIVGISDEPLQKVTRFLCTRNRADARLHNDRTRYRLATDPDRSAFDDYMSATHQRGLPKAFIIGRTGRLEWVGHPVAGEMDVPLESIVDGTWSRQPFKDEFTTNQRASDELWRATSKLSMATDAQDWDAALEAVDVIIGRGKDTYIPTKLGIFLWGMKDYDWGYAYARQIMEQAWDDNAWLLMQVAWVVSDHKRFPIPDEHRDLDLALEAISRANELTEQPPEDSLAMQASIEFRLGRFDEAVGHQQLALKRLKALQERVAEHELEGYRELVGRYAATVEEYRQRVNRGSEPLLPR